jgi:hypothetical protein
MVPEGEAQSANWGMAIRQSGTMLETAINV